MGTGISPNACITVPCTTSTSNQCRLSAAAIGPGWPRNRSVTISGGTMKPTQATTATVSIVIHGWPVLGASSNAPASTVATQNWATAVSARKPMLSFSPGLDRNFQGI